MEIPSSCNHSMIGSLAKEQGFPAHKHKYKSNWCLAVEVMDALVPSGILLCLSLLFPFHFFCLSEKAMAECIPSSCIVAKAHHGRSQLSNTILLRKRVLELFFFFLIFFPWFTEMTLLCLSFCPFACFCSLSAFFCFQVIWAVMHPLFLLYFVQVTSSLTR